MVIDLNALAGWLFALALTGLSFGAGRAYQWWRMTR